jgi:hypothetical protein
MTFSVLDVWGQVVETYVGTDDAGATPTDPTGGGADPNNNMVLVTAPGSATNAARSHPPRRWRRCQVAGLRPNRQQSPDWLGASCP